MRRVTVTDVAADAGVSRATVSLVLNGNPVVAEATRQRVNVSIERLGYVYDRAAASLRKARAHAVGLILTQLTNPFFATFAEGLQGACDDQGIDVLLGVSQEDPVRQRRLLTSMAQRRVDGVVCMPATGSQPQDFAVAGMPVVLFSRRLDGLPAAYVGADNHGGAYAAAAHLHEVHGVTRVAFVGGSPHSSARTERLAGLRQAMADRGIHAAIPAPTCAPDRGAAHRTTLALLREMRTTEAILALNDVTAFGVVDAARDTGRTVGSDVLVFGFDDIPDAALASPSLASVRVDSRAAGTHAARMLLERIDAPGETTTTHLLPTVLKPRATCGCGERT